MSAAEINKRLRGRRIVKVLLRRFNARDSSLSNRVSWATDPLIVLDDGTTISFQAQETEIGEYGVALCISDAARAAFSRGRA